MKVVSVILLVVALALWLGVGYTLAILPVYYVERLELAQRPIPAPAQWLADTPPAVLLIAMAVLVSLMVAKEFAWLSAAALRVNALAAAFGLIALLVMLFTLVKPMVQLPQLDRFAPQASQGAEPAES
jgi:hypothetical protein